MSITPATVPAARNGPTGLNATAAERLHSLRGAMIASKYQTALNRFSTEFRVLSKAPSIGSIAGHKRQSLLSFVSVKQINDHRMLNPAVFQLLLSEESSWRYIIPAPTRRVLKIFDAQDQQRELVDCNTVTDLPALFTFFVSCSRH